MFRLTQWFMTLGVILGLILAGCASPSKPSPAPAPEKPAAGNLAQPTPTLTREQQLIEGAKKEGEVVFWVNTMTDADRF